MALSAISEKLDQRRTKVGARPLRCPLHGCINGKRVVPIHPQAGDAISDRALGERGALGPGDP